MNFTDFLAPLSTVLSGIGIGLKNSALNTQFNNNLQTALNRQAIAGFEAKQLETNANWQRAIGTMAATNQKRQAEFDMSRLITVAASQGGGGMSDPSTASLAARLMAEHAYRAQIPLAASQESARQTELKAKALKLSADYGVEQAESDYGALQVAKGANLITGASSMFEKYFKAQGTA